MASGHRGSHRERLLRIVGEIELRLGAGMERQGLLLLRLGLGTVFVWFGAFTHVLGVWEMVIGICFLCKPLLRVALIQQGETLYLTGGPATATVEALEPTRYLFWERPFLEELTTKQPTLYHAMLSGVNLDLITKLLSPQRRTAPAPDHGYRVPQSGHVVVEG